MISVMMRLGQFDFSLSTAAYQQFSRATAYRWQGQNRYGQLPAQQFTGYGDDTITLAGVIIPEFSGGLHQLDKLRAEADKGAPLPLIDGLGQLWWPWVIQSIEETQAVLLSNGLPRRLEFNLKLIRYGLDI